MADNKTFKDGGGTDYSHALQDISSVFYTKIVGAAADDAAAGGNPIMMGGKYIATPSALSADGDAGYVLLNQYRGVCVQLMDSSGNLINPVSKNEDDAHSSGDAGQPVWAVRRDAKAVGSGADGDYSSLNVNAAGDLRVDGGQVYAFENAPTVTAGAYSANDCVGGEIEITNAARASGAGGVITQIVMAVEDDSSNGVAADDYEIWLFKSNPGGTYTDNTALAVTDADAFEVEAIVTLDEKFSGGNVSILQAKNLNIGYVCDATSLWAVVVDRTGNTLEATDAIQLRFKMIRD